VFSYLIFGITYAFAAAVQPGPLQTYIISPILILILFLLSTMPANFIVILRIGGGLFLLYLAFKAFQSWQQFEADKTAIDESGRQTLFNAVFVNLLNPNPYLGWSLIMGPLFLEGWKIAPANGIALIASFYLTMILTLAGIIILFGFARKLGPQVSKVLIGLSSFVLLAFGIYQLWLGIISVSII